MLEHSQLNCDTETHQRRWPARCLAIAVLVLYLGSVGPQWYVSSDSALYLLLGKNLAAGDGYTLWDTPHAHVPPGFPAILAIYRWLGLDEMRWLNLAMSLTALATLTLVYWAMQTLVAPNRALLITALVALGQEMHLAAGMQLSDLPCMLLVWLGLWAYLRGTAGDKPACLELGTLALLASCWTRVIVFPLAAAAGLGLLLSTNQRHRRRIFGNAVGLAVGLTASVALFYQWAAWATTQTPVPTYGHHFSSLANRDIGAWLAGPVRHFYETGPHIMRLFTGQSAPELLALLVFWLPIAIGTVRSVQRREMVVACALIGYLASVLVLRTMFSRYLLPVAPLLAMNWLDGIAAMVAMRSPYRHWAPRIAIGAAILLMAISLPKVVRLAIAVHQEPFANYRADWELLRQTAADLRRHAQPGDRFISSRAQRQLSWLSGMASTPLSGHAPNAVVATPADLDRLRKKGVCWLVVAPETEHAIYQRLPELVAQSPECQLLADHSKFRVYRLPRH